jgi:membrane protein YqaA with SNARE-associated domain
MQYPPKKFVAALAVGRAVRYSVIAFLGATFGRHILRFFARYYRPALYGLICLAVVGAIVALALWYKHRHVIAQEAAAAKQENAEEKAAQYH